MADEQEENVDEIIILDDLDDSNPNVRDSDVVTSNTRFSADVQVEENIPSENVSPTKSPPEKKERSTASRRNLLEVSQNRSAGGDEDGSILMNEPQMEREISELESIVGHPLFCQNAVDKYMDVAKIFALKAKDSNKVCESVPQVCPIQSATFLIEIGKLSSYHDIYVDSYGSWGKSSGENRYFSVQNQIVSRVDRNGKMSEGATYDLKISRRMYKHKDTDHKLRKSIFVSYEEGESVPKWGLITYKWDCDPYIFQPAAHGNSKKKSDSYQPSAKSTLDKIRNLASTVGPQAVFDRVSTQMGGMAQAVSGAYLPRDVKQIQNVKYRIP